MLQHLTDGDIDLVTDFYYRLQLGPRTQCYVDVPLPDPELCRRIAPGSEPSEPANRSLPPQPFYTHEFIEKMYPAAQLRYYETVVNAWLQSITGRQI
jgi:hypothetical protein